MPLSKVHPFRINKKPIKVIVLGMLLFFYLYSIHFTFLPLNTSRIVLLIGLTYFSIRFFFNPTLLIDRSVLVILAIYSVYLYWVVLISGFQGFRDITIIISIVLLLVHVFVGGLFFAVMFRKLDFSFRALVLVFQVVITVQAFFIILYFVSWQFREFTFAYIPGTGNIDYTENLFRSRGLTNSTGAKLSVLQSFGLLFTAYLLSTVNYRSKQFFYLLLSFALLILSIFLAGRTGLLVLPFIFVYFLAVLIIRKGLSKNIVYFMIITPLLLIVAYVAFRFTYQIISNNVTDAAGEDVIERVIRWYVKEFFVDGKIQSRTASKLFADHWFLPEENSVLIFGDPSTFMVNRISSDVGYIRMIHGVGIIGILLFYFLYSIKFIYMITGSIGKSEKIMLALLGIYILITEMKEPMIMHLSLNSVFVLLFAFVFLKNKVAKPTSENESPSCN